MRMYVLCGHFVTSSLLLSCQLSAEIYACAISVHMWIHTVPRKKIRSAPPNFLSTKKQAA